ncbi:MAG: STM4015 family protein [Gluconacetobacter diazotrophicus]|nr:STM4015 family protein [Gluconacetobacter diazotrophicus]
MISEHATEWLGYPVETYDPDKGTTPDYRNKVYRLASDYDAEEPLTDVLARFLDNPGSEEIPALIFGLYGEHDSTPAPIIEALVALRERLPKLRGVFLGDIVSEENEISWINQCDVSPLFRAYPGLEHFRIRGTNGLELGEIHHAKLKSLVIESGGLDVGVLREAVAEDLPGLERLEIWLGSESYGGNVSLSDLEPVLSGKKFPKLKYLGLRDSEIQDEIAAAVARAPVLARLETLDLSLGTLSDEGAAALLGSDAFYGLKKADLHHHYLSDGMMARLKGSGVNVDLREQQQDQEWRGEVQRYIAVSE